MHDNTWHLNLIAAPRIYWVSKGSSWIHCSHGFIHALHPGFAGQFCSPAFFSCLGVAVWARTSSQFCKRHLLFWCSVQVQGRWAEVCWAVVGVLSQYSQKCYKSLGAPGNFRGLLAGKQDSSLIWNVLLRSRCEAKERGVGRNPTKFQNSSVLLMEDSAQAFFFTDSFQNLLNVDSFFLQTSLVFALLFSVLAVTHNVLNISKIDT